MFEKEDPIVKQLASNHYNMLTLPDSGFEVGDVFMTQGSDDSATYLGHINDVLIPAHISLQKYHLDSFKIAQIGNLVNIKSKEVSRKFGLNFLLSFLSILGNTRLKTDYESNYDSGLIFRISGAFSEYIEPIKLGENIGSYKINTANKAVNPNGRFFVASAIAKSKSINVSSKDSDHQSVKADVQASVVGGSAEFDSQASEVQGYTFFGETPAVFGIRLHELKYGPVHNIIETPADNTPRKVTRAGPAKTVNPLINERTAFQSQGNIIRIKR